MHHYKQYKLFIGTAMPFEQWPQRILAFFNDRRFSPHTFDYRLECISGDGCARAAVENPILGTVCTDPARTGYMQFRLTGDCPEIDFLSLLPKLCRRYGISDMYLHYHTFDPHGRQVSICLHRQTNNTARWSGIELCVDLTDASSISVADAYRDALLAVFPVRDTFEQIETEFTDAEAAQYKELNQQAQSLIKKFGDLLAKKVSASGLTLIPKKSASLGTLLKKKCAQYGYTYVLYTFHMHFIQKRTANGHFIHLEIDNGRCGGECNINIRFSGLGFEHSLGHVSSNNLPHALFLDRFFQALSETEGQVFPELDTLFPPTPDWYTTL